MTTSRRPSFTFRFRMRRYSSASGDRSNAPSAEEIIVHQRRGDRAGAPDGGDPRKQTLSGVRASYLTLLLLAVQRQRIHADLFAPELSVEIILQRLRLSTQPPG